MSGQKIHPDILPLVDQEYVDFHNKHLTNLPKIHEQPWDPAIRQRPAVPGGSQPLEVREIQDVQLENCKARTFVPFGDRPSRGWPVLIYFHGGGWTLGGIGAENSFATRMCTNAQCVVLSVDYRLAPEQPYPAAVEDATSALHWVFGPGGASFGVDFNRVAVGGSSSGGNLAAVLSLKAHQMGITTPLLFQLLVVPVTDAASRHASWQENSLTPWLSPARMTWFIENYTPNAADRSSWEVSPIMAPDELLSKSPKTWIGVCELDILRDEGISYGQKLKRLDVETEVVVYAGAPHPIMAMDGVLTVGKKLVADASQALANAFRLG